MITVHAPKDVVKALLFAFSQGITRKNFWYHVEGGARWAQVMVPKWCKKGVLDLFDDNGIEAEI